MQAFTLANFKKFTKHYTTTTLHWKKRCHRKFRDNKRPVYIMLDKGNYIWLLEQLYWVLISRRLPQFSAYKKVNQQLQLSFTNSLAQLTTSETLLHATKNVWEWTGMKWDVLRYDINIRIRKRLLLYRMISINLYGQKTLFRNEHILIILKPQISWD